LEVFDDLGGDDVGSGEIGAAFEALKARPLLTRVTASSSQKMSRLNFGACSNVEYLDATPFPQTVSDVFVAVHDQPRPRLLQRQRAKLPQFSG
jgi:hypothetical protein